VKGEGDHRARRDISAGICYPAGISSGLGYHSSFLLHLQGKKSPYTLCCDTCPSLAGRGVDLLAALFLFAVTISLDGHFLTNEAPELILMQNSSHPLPDLNIIFFNSKNNTVRPKVIPNKARQEYVLKLQQLEAKDSGTWMCHVHSDSPLINQNISFDVKVLGM